MRKFFSFTCTPAAICLIFLLTTQVSQANPVRISEGENALVIPENHATGFRATYTFAEFSSSEVKNSEGIFTRLVAGGHARSGAFGSPELPVKSEFIELPAGAGASVRILSTTFREFSMEEIGVRYPLLPNQPPVSKSGGQGEFAYDPAAYRTDAFFPADIAGVEYLGEMRGTGIGRLDIFPIQYNPVSGRFRILERLEIEISYDDGALLPGGNDAAYRNHYFEPVYRSLANYRETLPGNRENLTRYPVKYVIVSDRMFEAQLQQFIEWKTRKGFRVIEAYTDDPNVGTTTYQIKTYLEGLYLNATPEDPAPSFVLFVGDIAQVPAWIGEADNHVTDLYYCEYTGDYFPEVFYGRFSAQNPAQLQPQIDKTLAYEQYLVPSPAYLDTVVMIAGVDGTFAPTHGNGQINYGTINYFNETNGLYSHTYLYPASGSSSAAIRQNISDGVTYANYTAHGSPDGWADPGFTVGHIAGLASNGKVGLLVGNCCSTSEYQVGECFGEALLRAENKGAVGYIGASNSTYWDEDYYFGIGVGQISGNPPSYEETTLGFYDRAFHTHGEPFAEWYTTSSQMIYAGNLAVTLGSPGMAEYYWEAYCLMGDPSLMVYFSTPPAMTVSHAPLAPLGSAVFEVTAAPYAYVAISMDGELFAAALADSNGLAVLDISGITTPGMAEIVATAQNFQPWTGQVLVASPEGPYVMMNGYQVNDYPNANGMVEPGEEVKIGMELKNWGNSDAADVTAILMTNDEYVTLIGTSAAYGVIAAQDSVMLPEAFHFMSNDLIPDQHEVLFDVLIENTERETWNSSFSLTLNAPVMEIGNLLIVDTAGGNGNNRLDAGETVDLVVNCHNSGHCDAHNIITVLQSYSPYITLHNDSVTFDTLAWSGMHQAVFTITLADSIETGTVIDFKVTMASGYYADEKLFYPQAGLLVEDFETGGFEAFGWMMGGNQPWQVTGSDVYEGAFSARSGVINDNQTSELVIDLDVMVDDSISFYRRVSCEDDPGSNNYDWLGFYIDNVQVARWDGEEGWARFAYPVTAGQRTLKWVYRKDYSVASGADAAWIDYIIFPVTSPAVSVSESPEKAPVKLQIFPNPARDHATMAFSLESASVVNLEVLDLTGKKVAEIIPSTSYGPGMHRVPFDSSVLGPGMFFVRLITTEQTISKKLIISK